MALTGLPAHTLATLVHRGEVSAIEVIDEHLDLLDSLVAMNAVVARDDDGARQRAGELDARFTKDGPVGPLHGVPITVKDWIDVAGFPVSGETGDRNRRPATDATAVARLRSAGAIVIGITNVGTDHPLFGPCLHPLDPTRSPGGSSSGEAAAVRSGVSNLGLGSDSGGSIRLPAAWCGVAGLHPTFGRVPLTGHTPRVGARHDGRTVIGPLARTVADLSLALDVIAGPDGLDPACVPVDHPPRPGRATEPWRVGWFVEDEPGQAAPAVHRAVATSLAALARSGAMVRDEPMPAYLAESLDVTRRYWHRRELTGAEVDTQLWDWDRFSRRLLVMTTDLDVIVGPATADVAPLRRPLDDPDYLFTLAASLTGWPAVVVPCGTGDDGLPVAVQVVARPWHERAALAAASVIEAAANEGL